MAVIDLTADIIDLTVEDEEDGECPVCLDTKVLKTLTCNHGVCKPCWAKFTKPECPLCRAGQPRKSIRGPRASHPPVVIYNFQRVQEARRMQTAARQEAMYEYRMQELNSRFGVLHRAARLSGVTIDTTAVLAYIDQDIDRELAVPSLFFDA